MLLAHEIWRKEKIRVVVWMWYYRNFHMHAGLKGKLGWGDGTVVRSTSYFPGIQFLEPTWQLPMGSNYSSKRSDAIL